MALRITGEDPEKVSEVGMSGESRGTLTPDLPTPEIEMDTKTLSRLLRPFMETRKSGRDIITRSMLLVPRDDSVDLHSTDGVAYLKATLPAKVEGFTDPVIFDMESVNSVLRTGSTTTRIFQEGGALFVDFFGGRIFIPTYTFSPKLFQTKIPGDPSFEEEASKDLYHEAIQSLLRITSTADIPDLCYVFLTREGAFAANGSLVAKVGGKFIDCTLRQRDSSLILTILGGSQGDTVNLKVYPETVILETESVSYTFPIVAKRIPDVYRAQPGSVPERFTVSGDLARKVMAIFGGMPGSSGMLSLSFGEVLRGEVRSSKGNISDFVFSDSRHGNTAIRTVQTLIKTFQVALRVFKGEEDIGIGTRVDGSMVLFTNTKSLSFTTRMI